MEGLYVFIVVAVVVGILVWWLTGSLLVWRLPNGAGRTLVPAILGAFAGALWAARFGGGYLWIVVGAAVGSVVVLYVAMAVGVPSHASIVVNSTVLSSEEGRLKREGHIPPYSWPMNAVAGLRGSVTWYINDPPAGSTISILFKKGNPFGTDPKGGLPGFSASANSKPVVIAAAPIVRSGSFPYQIDFVLPNGSVVTLDPKIDIPKMPRYP